MSDNVEIRFETDIRTYIHTYEYSYLPFLRRLLRLATCTCVWVVLHLVTEDIAVDRGVIVVTALYQYLPK